MVDWLPAVVLFGVMGWILTAIPNAIRRYKVAQLQSELQTKLIDKFTSGAELATYMQSDAGRKFVDALTFEATSPVDRILGALQVGLVLMAAGGALIYSSYKLPETDIMVLGPLSLCVGAAFILSAAVSYVFSKSAGLLDRLTDQR